MSLMIVSTTNLGSTGTHTPLKKSYKKNVKRSLINPGCMLAMYRRSLARAISRPVRWADAQSSLTGIATMKFKSRLTAVYIAAQRSEEHTSELQSRGHLVCRLLLERKRTSVR